MAIKLSNSGINRFLGCGESYKLRYINRLVSTTKSSAFYFGSAVDQALNFMLENKDNTEVQDLVQATYQIFMTHWEQQTNNKYEMQDLPMNPMIVYSKYDYDNDMLEKSDWREIFQLVEQESYEGIDFFKIRNQVDELRKANVDWEDIREDYRIAYNFSSWLCIKNKALKLIQAYNDEILPKFKRIVCVQKTIELPDDCGNVLNGVIDFVAELQDGTIAVMDNKTSSVVYSQDSVRTSQQLALYKKLLNIKAADPEDEWTSPVTAAGYAVLGKKLEVDKVKVCKSCRHTATGSHKKCDADVDGERCNGEWDVTKTFKVNTQFIIDTIGERFEDNVFETADTVKNAIEAGIFAKNFGNCINKYNQKCEFFNRCHAGIDKGIEQLPEKTSK